LARIAATNPYSSLLLAFAISRQCCAQAIVICVASQNEGWPMSYECDLRESDVNPVDDRTAGLTEAVESLSDSELRDLLVALLSEWRKRCDVKELPRN